MFQELEVIVVRTLFQDPQYCSVKSKQFPTDNEKDTIY